MTGRPRCRGAGENYREIIGKIFRKIIVKIIANIIASCPGGAGPLVGRFRCAFWVRVFGSAQSNWMKNDMRIMLPEKSIVVVGLLRALG